MSVTRRKALTSAAAVAVALPLVRAVPAGAAISGDAGVLTKVAKIEQLLRFTYDAAATGMDETPDLQATFRGFATQEAEHLGALATSLEALGAPKPVAPASAEEAAAAAAALGIDEPFEVPASPVDAVEFALAAETVAQRMFEQAAAALSDLNLLQTSLTILGCQAQHAAVLRATLGRGPVPRPALIRS